MYEVGLVDLISGIPTLGSFRFGGFIARSAVFDEESGEGRW